MTTGHEERLYNLLPAIYRQRDFERGEPLRTLLAVIQGEMNTLEEDIEGLYANWFIETADEWVIPYLGDLLGVRNLNTIESAGVYSLRAYVANTLRYRQGKGTPAVLEQLANDISGWQARVVEFFKLLATTQHLNHLRPSNVRTPDLRQGNELELLDSPFDTAGHTAEVRRLTTRQGRYNIPHVGLFLWRLQAYPIQRISPRQVAGGDRRFRLHPVGLDSPLFNRPEAEPSIRHLATERNVPTPIRRREMDDNKEAYTAPGEAAVEFYFDGARLNPDEIAVCHLSEWDKPGWALPQPAGGERVAVDPVSGRFVILPPEPLPGEITVSATTGFSGDVGGGPYDRNETLERSLTGRWVRRVSRDGSGDFTTLEAAVAAWNGAAALTAGLDGVIAVTDNLTYEEDLTGAAAILIPARSKLLLIAVQPFDPVGGRLDAAGSRTHLLGNLSVDGTAPTSPADPDSSSPGSLTIDGLLIEGIVRVRQGNLGEINLRHCTIVPRPAGLIAPSASNSRLHVALYRSICGGIELSETIPDLSISESIVDALDGADLIAPGARVAIDRSTVRGANDDLDGLPALRELHATESIFTGRIHVERRQIGCIRFCRVPDNSRTPRRFRCQPDLALEGVTGAAERQTIRTAMRPQFTSTQYGHPGYFQLDRSCALEIRTGAEDGSEMGVFHYLKQPQREKNLEIAIEEYLPFGLEAGLFFVT